VARDQGGARLILSATDYSQVRWDAAVDWVELTIHLPRPSQPQHVQARMPAEWGRPYVLAHSEHPSRTATVFSFRVQDPGGPAAVMAGLRRLVPDGEPALTEHQVSITAVEIALDGYRANSDRAALEDLAFDLFNRQALLPRSLAGARLCPPADAGSKASMVATPMPIRRALQNGWTINDGTRGDEFERRWYVKDRDSRLGQQYGPLPVEQHRVRAEVTLRGAHLPFATITEWKAFRFQTLRHPYFAWRLAAEDLQHLPGLPRRLGRLEGSERTGERRKTLRNTKPDAELHRHAKNALERLTRQQRRG
jgi:hypothetical protein